MTMKSQLMTLARRGLAVACTALLAGCDKPDALDSSLVEVRVVGEWTHDDWKKSPAWSNPYYPHAIVEITETGERGRIFGNSIGATGEVFRVKRWHIREAGK